MARGTLRPLSVAPMMDRTDRHHRWFMRQITADTLLYTEMVTANAILHGDRDRLLGFDPIEHPVAVQLGGDDAVKLAECARIAVDLGYDEVNLNVGCPSARVQSGSFGACLMRTPETVARAVRAMRAAVDVPVTVKHRIGVDELDQYEHMAHFVRVVAAEGADRFTVHARKAWLNGLSPKENRTIPPLRYEDVYRLKAELPALAIEINGGIRTLEEVERHLGHVDAAMLGRAAYDTPWIFADADVRYFGAAPVQRSRAQVALAVEAYLGRWTGRPGHKPLHIVRHLLPLYAGIPGARIWKRTLTEGVQRGLGHEVVPLALAALDERGILATG